MIRSAKGWIIKIPFGEFDKDILLKRCYQQKSAKDKEYPIIRMHDPLFSRDAYRYGNSCCVAVVSSVGWCFRPPTNNTNCYHHGKTQVKTKEEVFFTIPSVASHSPIPRRCQLTDKTMGNGLELLRLSTSTHPEERMMVCAWQTMWPLWVVRNSYPELEFHNTEFDNGLVKNR